MIKILLNIIALGFGLTLWQTASWFLSSDHEVYFLDVGQGDSALITYSQPCDYKWCELLNKHLHLRLYQKQVVLIDGGPDLKALDRTSTILPWWNQRVDLLILTHPHDDHLAGLMPFINRFNINSVLYNPVYYENYLYQEWQKQSLAIQQDTVNSARIFSAVKEEYPWLEIIFPSLDNLANNNQNSFNGNINNDSVIVRASFGSESVLFMGDAEHELEQHLMSDNSALDMQASILKAGHHCSDTSTSQEFGQVVQPIGVVCSVGEGNKYGHPSVALLRQLKDQKIKVWRTDQQGTVKFTFSSSGGK